MTDELDKLAESVRVLTIEYAAKVAEAHRRTMMPDSDQFQIGYNQAIADIAAKLRSDK